MVKTNPIYNGCCNQVTNMKFAKCIMLETLWLLPHYINSSSFPGRPSCPFQPNHLRNPDRLYIHMYVKGTYYVFVNNLSTSNYLSLNVITFANVNQLIKRCRARAQNWNELLRAEPYTKCESIIWNKPQYVPLNFIYLFTRMFFAFLYRLTVFAGREWWIGESHIVMNLRNWFCPLFSE